MWLLLLPLLFLASPAQAADPCPNGDPVAFVGAEGFGRCAQGGRGGVTLDVTNLNNSGVGSLRQCAEVATGKRTCRFTVSGTIALTPVAGNSSDISIVNDFVTIDGSTAPAGGIALKDGGLTIKANHVIVRHIRVRPGLASWLLRGVNSNCIAIQGNEGVPKSNIIVDHITCSWMSDDGIYVIYGNDLVTIQWSIISEGIINCPGSCGGKGFLMGYGAQRVSFHHNLSAHNWIRWPEYTGGGNNPGHLDFVNNVQYNGNGTDTIMWGYHGPQFANFVGCYWKQGLDGPATKPQNQLYGSIRTIGQQTYTSQSGIYVHDNYGRYFPLPCNGCNAVIGQAVPDERIIWGDNGGIPKVTIRYPYPLVTTTTPAQAFLDVLAGAGAFPRDSVDTRVINDVRNGTGHWLDHTKTPLTAASWPVLTAGAPPPPPPPPPVDTDNDGTPDNLDQCPTVPGPASNNGCPLPIPPPPPVDTDGDGFPDSTDACPTVAGVAPNGCPIVVPPPPVSLLNCPNGIINTLTPAKMTTECKP